VQSRTLVAQTGAFLLLFSSSLYVNAAQDEAERAAPVPPQQTTATRQNVVGIPSFAKVTPRLYRGGQPGIKDLGTLKTMGIDIVVNMRGGRNRQEEAEVKKLGMRYVSIPWHCPLPKDGAFARFLKLIRNNPGKKIFVHCRLGDDRTGMAVAAYRMSEEGWSADEAMKEMEAFGFAGVHRVICPTLAEYERTFPKRLETSPAFRELRPHRTSDTPK